MMNKVILDQNLNGGLKKVVQERHELNLNRHAEGLNIFYKISEDSILKKTQYAVGVLTKMSTELKPSCLYT
jgi:hypothetical protein